MNEYTIRITDSAGKSQTIGGFASYQAAAEATDQPDVAHYQISDSEGVVCRTDRDDPTEHRTIHAASPSGTHPSCRSAGVHAFECAECGREVRYAERLGEDYVWHDGEKVGYRDIGNGDDLCPKCERDRFEE